MENKLCKVLYVDDEEINLRLFSKIFRKDFNIVTATSAKEALKIAETEHIDVLITDQKMPEMTGVELLKNFNTLYPDIPPSRMIISGYSLNTDIEEAFDKYQLYQYIQKPWNYDNLKKLILESLNSK